VLSALAVAVAVALLALTLARAGRAWPREAHLSYVEGIWISMAIDANHGTFYRPMEGPLGYGGTRYFPLFFTLHAGLMRAGLGPVAAGYALSAASVALLLAGMATLLLRLGVGPLLTTAAAAVALSCQPVQMALLGIRGDGLAAALAVCGLAATLSPGRTMAAAALFALAFAAKPTSVYAPAAAMLALALGDRARDSWRLALLVLAGAMLVLLGMQLASDGRALTTIAASAGGGAGVASALTAPLSFARIVRRVPESAFFIQLAAAVLMARLARPAHVGEAALLLCLASTVAIYASPATVENHLIDLSVLAVIVVSSLAASRSDWTPGVLAVLIVGGLSAAASASWRLTTVDQLDARSVRHAVLAEVGAARQRMLTDQPMLSAAAGAQPYLLDPYQLSVRLGRDPRAIDRMVADLERRAFDVVVFEHESLDLVTVEIFPGETGRRVRSALLANYRLDTTVEGRAVYRPR
jgi:hypothetical protein